MSMKLVLGTMTFGESVFAPEPEKFIRKFLEAGYDELDTAYVYNNGQSERLIGEALKTVGRENVKIATKVNPRITGRLDGESAFLQLNESLERLGIDYVDTFYLHFPDPNTPIESVLEACGELYRQGKFRELGVSNFPAWMLADLWHKCDGNGCVKPAVFEGIYNPLTRKAETELNSALNHFGMRFYAYNPLAGGLLTGRYGRFEDSPSDGRFTHRPNYQNRYWKKSYFESVELLKDVCGKYGITTIEATYRWLANHSMLNEERGDAVIIGASKLSHLMQNMEIMKYGSLPDEITETFAKAWEICRPDSPEYFTLYKGSSK